MVWCDVVMRSLFGGVEGVVIGGGEARQEERGVRLMVLRIRLVVMKGGSAESARYSGGDVRLGGANLVV